jgi:glycosyltransferase involved in cell wall biosynthesis
VKIINLSDLPPPPHGKVGWPWTEGSEQLPERMSSGHCWPKISVITPSYNYGGYIEETIRSVLLQGYPNLEYIIIDGGSSDDTCSIINKYRKWIDFFVSEKDAGLTDALLKGFDRVTGDWLGWQNADDFYGRNAFYNLGMAFDQGVVSDLFHGVTFAIDDERSQLGVIRYDYGVNGLDSFPLVGLANQSLVIATALLRKNGFVDRGFAYAMDSELMSRLISIGAQMKFVPSMEGYYRIHGNALTFRGGFDSAIESCRICELHLNKEYGSGIPSATVLTGYARLIRGLYRNGQILECKRHAIVYLRNSFSLGILIRYILAVFGGAVVKKSLRLRSSLERSYKV